MVNISACPQSSMPNMKFFTPNKTHVIELYCSSKEYIEQVGHEVISGTDAGSVLTEIFGQEIRFVYAPDADKFNRLLVEANSRGYTKPIINLYDPENIDFLLVRVNHGDSILINGQGDVPNQLIAGYDAEILADILKNDLGLKKFQLKNLDIDSCMMGRIASYRDELKRRLKCFQTITTYIDLCTVSRTENRLCRMWIEEKKTKIIFIPKVNLIKRNSYY